MKVSRRQATLYKENPSPGLLRPARRAEQRRPDVLPSQVYAKFTDGNEHADRTREASTNSYANIIQFMRSSPIGWILATSEATHLPSSAIDSHPLKLVSTV